MASYRILTDVTTPPLYFCGVLEETIAAMALSPVFFDAYAFDTRKEAEEAMDELQLSEGWAISEIIAAGVFDEDGNELFNA